MPKDDLDELYPGHDENDEPLGAARNFVESKHGYTTCPECGLQSVKGANSTHVWCVQIAKLRERVRALEQALSQERGLVDRVDMILALGPDEKPRTD